MKLMGKYTAKGICKHTVWLFVENGRVIGVNRNHDVFGDQYHISEPPSGEGCGTIWYPNLETAKREVERLFRTGEKVKTGRDSGLCERCSNHYSYGTEEYAKYPAFACCEWKKEYVRALLSP